MILGHVICLNTKLPVCDQNSHFPFFWEQTSCFQESGLGAHLELSEAKDQLQQGLETLRQTKSQHLALREEVMAELTGQEVAWDRRVVPSDLVFFLKILEHQKEANNHKFGWFLQLVG